MGMGAAGTPHGVPCCAGRHAGQGWCPHRAVLALISRPAHQGKMTPVRWRHAGMTDQRDG
jgi:hypothetical protein